MANTPPALAPTAAPSAFPRRQLTLFDSTSIIMGIIIGAGIYESSPVIAACVPGIPALVGVWVLGGVLSLLGALCYVELGTAYPREGGDYVFISRAFGRGMGFVFAWAQLWVVRPGSIGAMAYVFARYAHHLVPICTGKREYLGWVVYAAGSILVLSLVNVLGVRQGKWTQNLLTTAKVLGLVAVAVVGLLWASPVAQAAQVQPVGIPTPFAVAMILVLFAYGGWHEMAYVGAEVRHPHKNIFRAMLLGTVAVAAVYVLVNLAFVHALGLQGTRNSPAAAADVLKLGFGVWGDRFVSVLISVSALAAVNGQIFTGARIYYAMGQDHYLFSSLGRWHARLRTPVRSLVVQAVITLAIMLGFAAIVRTDLIPRDGFGSAFVMMIVFTGPMFWGFMALVAVALLLLRYREPQVPRPYHVPLYPVVPLVFCACSLFMTYSSLKYAVEHYSHAAIWALSAMAVGVVLAFFDPKPPAPPDAESPQP
jgi:amino acid transporter